MSGPRLAGKRALVTGGGRGLGLAVANRFSDEGATVTILDRTIGDLRPANDREGRHFNLVTGDVSDPGCVLDALSAATTADQPLDILVCNAAVFDSFAPLSTLELEELPGAFHELFAINVLGQLLPIRAALESLARVNGCIIVTASVASIKAGGGGVLYTASKHALVGVIKQLAKELAPLGVRVNGVAPGAIDTELSGVSSLGQGRFSVRDRVSNRGVPLGAIPSADDYSGLFVTLADTADNVAVTGSVFLADSGLSVIG